MRKYVGKVLVILCILILFLISCGDAAFTNLNKEVKEIATKLNAVYEKNFETIQEISQIVKNHFETTNWEDINLEEELKNNPDFKLAANGMWGRTNAPPGSHKLVIAIIMGEINDESKKRLMDLLKIEPKVVEIFDSVKYYTVGSYLEDKGISFTYPPFDVASTLPFGIDWNMFDWYKLRKEAKKPFYDIVQLDLGPHGLIQGLGDTVVVNGNSIGMVSLPLKINTLAGDLLKETRDIVFITNTGLNVLGASQKAKDIIKLKVILEFDYLSVIKDQPQLVDEFTLKSDKQPPDLLKLGQMITKENVGKDNLSITIYDKKYKVIIEESPIPGDTSIGNAGTNFVVGLI